jgi:hypothetical protein
MKVKRLLVWAAVVVALVVVWLVFNPPGRFGWCCFGYTTFGGLPRPVTDLQVRADGAVRKVPKTHALSRRDVEWLLQPLPEVLIISTGWEGVVKPDEELRTLKGVEVKIVDSGEAKALFNQLRKAGRRVAIHFHSTC